MTYQHAMKVAQHIADADPFTQRDLHAFLVAVKCTMMSAKTGKGHYIVKKRHAKTIYDYAANVADATGTIETIVNAVAPKISEIVNA